VPPQRHISFTLGKIAAAKHLSALIAIVRAKNKNHADVGVATDAPNKLFNKRNGLAIDD
jgi:hypothetical protein